MGPVRPARLAVLWTVAAALAAAPALAGDIILNQSGKPLGNPKASVPPQEKDFEGSEWEVIDETLSGVSYQIPGVGQAQTLPANVVKAVYHDPTLVPEALLRGKALAESGNSEAAREQFARVQKDAEARPWAKAEAAYLLAETYLADSNFAEAEKQLAAFKSSFGASKWVTRATEQRARALLALEKIDDAKTEFASLRKLPGVSEEVGTESDFWLVWIDEQVAVRRKDQAALDKVLKTYAELIQKLSGKSQYESLSRRAQIGRASCLIELGRAADAKTELTKIAGEAKDPRVLAAAYNKLGTATWRAAPTDKAEMKQALFHYLRVASLYGDAPGAEDDSAEAMFHAGELFKELRDQHPDNLGRARGEWSRVIAMFPASEWARKAKEAMVSR